MSSEAILNRIMDLELADNCVMAEYIWIDGSMQQCRSKTKVGVLLPAGGGGTPPTPLPSPLPSPSPAPPPPPPPPRPGPSRPSLSTNPEETGSALSFRAGG